MERKIYVVGFGEEYANWMQGELVEKLEDADLIVFTGGEDVHPSLYHEPIHSTTSANLSRDIRERGYFKQALSLKKHMIGICRGSQFLCVMSGGKLVQHQENPEYIHWLETFDKEKEMAITSTHHQAQYPWNLKKNQEFKVLAWTSGLSMFHLDGLGKELPKAFDTECEIVHYPETKCLAIQGHPESMKPQCYPIKYLQNLLDKFMEDKI
jgi:gamma-glutamyl-gamma-aminobutyrate hydrolase PuuD